MNILKSIFHKEPEMDYEWSFQKRLFKNNFKLYILKYSERHGYTLWAHCLQKNENYYLGSYKDGVITMSKNFYQLPWGICKGGERMFRLVKDHWLKIVSGEI